MAPKKRQPTLRYKVGTTVAPGDRIGSLREGISPGAGTYARGGHVFASAVGALQLNGKSHDGNGFLVSVARRSTSSIKDQVLNVGCLVLCRVQRLQLQHVSVDILAGEYPIGVLPNELQGQIKREDIRSQASEEVKVQNAMRPGDIVLGRVLGLGDTRRYALSTAEVELGVVRAVCARSGIPMAPVSWKEMKCPKTGTKEPRKCAKQANIKEIVLGKSNAI